MTLREIASRIQVHLRRFEKDPVINAGKERGLSSYYMAGASASGNRVFVTYISYQGQTSLSKKDAEAFLAKLDGGYVGKHWEALRNR